MQTENVSTPVRTLIVVAMTFGVAACASPPVEPFRAEEDSAVMECKDMLIYYGSPLARVVADINRCFGTSLMVEAGIGLVNYRGGVKNEYLDDWLEGLEYAFGFVVDRTRPNVILLRSRAPSDPAYDERCAYRFKWQDARLDEMVADINRCFGALISFADDAAKGHRFTASFFNSGVASFIAIVRDRVPDLTVTTTDGVHFVISTR